MSQLTPVVDLTGQMTQEQINAANINNLMQESNKNDVDFQNFNETLIITDGSGIHRILIGVGPDGTSVGLYITKAGFDIVQQFS